MKRIYLYLLLLWSSTVAIQAQQTGSISGQILGEDQQPLVGVVVQLLPGQGGAVTDAQGKFSLTQVPLGQHSLRIRMAGYSPQTLSLQVSADNPTTIAPIVLAADWLGLDAVTITATRYETDLQEAPVVVNRIDSRIFEATQSLSLFEGLSFSPGLRVENNCQNCGFSQVRMNGLGGPYTQILINSRPVFSALVGVYGLDLLPANMIDRVEVTRGSGSVLYGGNAIAGTVNIITKMPVENSLQIGTTLNLIDDTTPDHALNVNGTWVTPDKRAGVSIYGFTRHRQPFDANADGFSEITALNNTSLGADAFFKPNERNLLRLGMYHLSELRRGGNAFDRPPHQADIAEQLQHRINGINLNYERFSADGRQKIALYSSLQHTQRNSYYGTGGRIIEEGEPLTEEDLLALNAYGQTTDLALVNGVQFTQAWSPRWILTLGSEWQYNEVDDQMPGYRRSIAQRVSTWGNYAQLEWTPVDKLSLLAGGRYDWVHIQGKYNFQDEQLMDTQIQQVLVPRVALVYKPTQALRLRTAYAQGYRAPQAFDEDLHISIIGGDAVFTRLAPDLQTERSESWTASVSYAKRRRQTQWSVLAELFHTRLRNPFITADLQVLPSGVSVFTKRNGSGAVVQGVNTELQWAHGSRWQLQLGATLQQAYYLEAEEIWAPETITELNAGDVLETTQLLRTPNLYGYSVLNWQTTSALSLALSGVYTGRMDVPHVIGTADGRTVIKRSPDFMELGLKLNYDWTLQKIQTLSLSLGVQNIFNSYQRDFDVGIDRDADYVYGPARPRTLFVGLKWGF